MHKGIQICLPYPGNISPVGREVVEGHYIPGPAPLGNEAFKGYVKAVRIFYQDNGYSFILVIKGLPSAFSGEETGHSLDDGARGNAQLQCGVDGCQDVVGVVDPWDGALQDQLALGVDRFYFKAAIGTIFHLGPIGTEGMGKRARGAGIASQMAIMAVGEEQGVTAGRAGGRFPPLFPPPPGRRSVPGVCAGLSRAR